jgi:ribokinase
MTAKLVVLGSFNMDLVAYIPRFPRAGESILGSKYLSNPGGKGSNQAVAAARLGADVTYVGRIGVDAFGDQAVEVWNAEHIHTRYVVRDPKNATGVSLIYVAESGSDNTIACVPGANMALSRKDVDAAAEAIARADVVLTQLENPLETTAYALRLGRQSGARTILNPAPAAPVLPDLLASADFITPNQTELEILTGGPYTDPAAAARQLMVDDRQTIIVTLSAEGALIVTRDREEHVPAFPVTVVDSTGAGDAFSAGLAVALAEGRETAEAVRFANAVAALCVTRTGTAQSMPVRAALDEFLETQR